MQLGVGGEPVLPYMGVSAEQTHPKTTKAFPSPHAVLCNS